MIPRYHVNVFWSQPDVCWIADVPDLKYCSAHGETAIEAMEQAQEAIQLWIEAAHDSGLAIPEPKYRPAIYAVSAAA